MNSTVMILTTLMIFKAESAALVQIEKCNIWLYTIGGYKHLFSFEPIFLDLD